MRLTATQLAPFCSAIFGVIMLAVLVVASAPGLCHAAPPPEMSGAQARQTLLTYLQPPDTTLTTDPSVSMRHGHTYYWFHGDQGSGPGADGGGNYRIDAATGEVLIGYVVPSAPAGTPRLPVPAQLTHAYAFAQAHFAGFSPDRFGTDAAATYDDDEYDRYTLDFLLKTPLMIDVPQYIRMELDAFSGLVSRYESLNLPLAVSPVPTISRDQAISSGRSWIFNNVSTDPADGNLDLPSQRGGYDPVQLHIVVDDTLNQQLRYELSFRSTVVYVDGFSGAATGSDAYASIAPARGPHGSAPRAVRIERLMRITLADAGSSSSPLNHAVAEVGNVAYIWAKYLDLFDIAVTRKGSLATLRNTAGKTLRIPQVTAKQGGWLQRRDGCYIPIASARILGAQLKYDGEGWRIVLPPRVRRATSEKH